MAAKGDALAGLGAAPVPPERWGGLRGASAAAAAPAAAGASASKAAASPFAVAGEPGRGWLVALRSSRTLTQAQQASMTHYLSELACSVGSSLLRSAAYAVPQPGIQHAHETDFELIAQLGSLLYTLADSFITVSLCGHQRSRPSH